MKAVQSATDHRKLELQEQSRQNADRARAKAIEKTRLDKMTPEERAKEVVQVKLLVSRASPSQAYPINSIQPVTRAKARQMMKAGEAAPVCENAKAIFAELGASSEPAEMLT